MTETSPSPCSSRIIYVGKDGDRSVATIDHISDEADRGRRRLFFIIEKRGCLPRQIVDRSFPIHSMESSSTLFKPESPGEHHSGRKVAVGAGFLI
jgi:hypothetical protein